MNEDTIESFVLKLTDFLNPMLPHEKFMRNFFDTDDKYEPLREFCLNYFEPYYTRERNYN